MKHMIPLIVLASALYLIVGEWVLALFVVGLFVPEMAIEKLSVTKP